MSYLLVCKGQQVPVGIIPKPPWFLRFDSRQLSVRVPRIILHICVSVDANISGVRSCLTDTTVTNNMFINTLAQGLPKFELENLLKYV